MLWSFAKVLLQSRKNIFSVFFFNYVISQNVKHNNNMSCSTWNTMIPVSYTHLDVYKRQQVDLERQIRYRSLRLIVLYKIRWSKIRIDARTMSLRSITPKIGRLSCKKCAMFERKTATDRLRTSNKVPFAPSHRPLQVSVVKNQNRPTDYEPAIKNPKNWSIIL